MKLLNFAPLKPLITSCTPASFKEAHAEALGHCIVLGFLHHPCQRHRDAQAQSRRKVGRQRQTHMDTRHAHETYDNMRETHPCPTEPEVLLVCPCRPVGCVLFVCRFSALTLVLAQPFTALYYAAARCNTSSLFKITRLSDHVWSRYGIHASRALAEHLAAIALVPVPWCVVPAWHAGFLQVCSQPCTLLVCQTNVSPSRFSKGSVRPLPDGWLPNGAGCISASLSCHARDNCSSLAPSRINAR